MNKVLYQRLGNILKQLYLIGVNTKYFFKWVLCLEDKRKQNVKKHHVIYQLGNKNKYRWSIHGQQHTYLFEFPIAVGFKSIGSM